MRKAEKAIDMKEMDKQSANKTLKASESQGEWYSHGREKTSEAQGPRATMHGWMEFNSPSIQHTHHAGWQAGT